MFGNIAYIYVGSAARIAFTLGLHTNGDASVRHSLHKQVDLRLFCSLYLLDLDISLCYGHPTAISEDIIPGVLKLPSEDVSFMKPTLVTSHALLSANTTADSESWIQHAPRLPRSVMSARAANAQPKPGSVPSPHPGRDETFLLHGVGTHDKTRGLVHRPPAPSP